MTPKAIGMFLATAALAIALLGLGVWKSNLAAIALSIAIFVAAPVVFAMQSDR